MRRCATRSTPLRSAQDDTLRGCVEERATLCTQFSIFFLLTFSFLKEKVSDKPQFTVYISTQVSQDNLRRRSQLVSSYP